MCFGRVKETSKETFLLRAQNLCLTEKNMTIIILGLYIYMPSSLLISDFSILRNKTSSP